VAYRSFCLINKLNWNVGARRSKTMTSIQCYADESSNDTGVDDTKRETSVDGRNLTDLASCQCCDRRTNFVRLLARPRSRDLWPRLRPRASLTMGPRSRDKDQKGDRVSPLSRQSPYRHPYLETISLVNNVAHSVHRLFCCYSKYEIIKIIVINNKDRIITITTEACFWANYADV